MCLFMTIVTFFYRGQQARSVLGQDGKHLSRFGTTKLAANLKSEILKFWKNHPGKKGEDRMGTMAAETVETGTMATETVVNMEIGI